jgi:hypothetical protein
MIRSLFLGHVSCALECDGEGLSNWPKAFEGGLSFLHDSRLHDLGQSIGRAAPGSGSSLGFAGVYQS